MWSNGTRRTWVTPRPTKPSRRCGGRTSSRSTRRSRSREREWSRLSSGWWSSPSSRSTRSTSCPRRSGWTGAHSSTKLEGASWIRPSRAALRAAAASGPRTEPEDVAESIIHKQLVLGELLDLQSFTNVCRTFVDLYKVGLKVFDANGTKLVDMKVEDLEADLVEVHERPADVG